MTDLDHNDLKYAGVVGENVTVTVEPQGTVQLVNYTLEGQTHPLKLGEDIRFALVKKAGDQPMVLQLVMDFTGAGSYRVVVKTVTNETNNECVHTWFGPPLAISNFTFYAD